MCMDGFWASVGDESVAAARIACPSSYSPDRKFFKIFKVNSSSSNYELIQKLANLKPLNSKSDNIKQSFFFKDSGPILLILQLTAR